MFDLPGTDSGREWIEVTNVGTTAENVEDYRLFEGNVNHTFTIILGDGVLSPNESLVIVSDPEKFKIDWPNFSGTIFDSSFSLSNTGETLILRDGDLVDADSLTYSAETGALGDGNSLQLGATGFVAGLPTPGSHGEGIVLGASTSTPNGPLLDISTHSTPEAISFVKEVVDITLATSRERVTLVGMPIIFEALALDSKSSSKSLDGVSYDWSMGDGKIQSGKKISYAYLEPGEYVVVVKAKFKESQAVSRTLVTVLPFEIKINTVVPGEYIELLNHLNTEANIGGALISNGAATFRLPDDTIILPKKKLRIPEEVIEIDLSGDLVYLSDASGKLIETFRRPATGEVIGAYVEIEKPVVSEVKSEVFMPVVTPAEVILPAKKSVAVNSETISTPISEPKKAFEPIKVISKKKDNIFVRTFRFFGNMF